MNYLDGNIRTHNATRTMRFTILNEKKVDHESGTRIAVKRQ